MTTKEKTHSLVMNLATISKFVKAPTYYNLDRLTKSPFLQNRITTLSEKTSLLGIHLQYIPRNMHTVFALLCFAVFIYRLIFPYPSGLVHSNDCPSASRATLMNMDKYFM